MSDNREAILERVHQLLGTLSGVASFSRDDGGLSETGPFPAAILLDGDERLVSNVDPLKFAPMPPALFSINPAVWLIAEQRDTNANLTLHGEPAPIGPELSAWRALIRATILGDDTLVTLVGGARASGRIIYRGCETDMFVDGKLAGQLLMKFEFIYALS